MRTGRTKRLFFLCAVFSFLCCTFVASATAQTFTVWAQAYGALGTEAASAVQQTSDGGYILAGVMNEGDDDVWVVKLDSSGAVTWDYTYGRIFCDPECISYNEKALAIEQTVDGGYIVAAETDTNNGDIWILKLTSDGATVSWNTLIGDSWYNDVSAIQQTSPDQGYILAGTISDGSQDDAWVIKLSSIGAIQWQYAYGDINENNHADHVQQTSDGGYIVSGYIAPLLGGPGDLWLMKLDANGTVEWQRTYDYSSGSDDEGMNDTFVQQTSSGEYIACADLRYGCSSGTCSDFWVLKLDSTGDIDPDVIGTWQTRIGGDVLAVPHEVRQTTDGGYVVVGELAFTQSSPSDVWVVKLDQTGSIGSTGTWQMSYGNGDWDNASAIWQTSDGGFVAAGQTTSFDVGMGDVFAIKTDPNGNIPGCTGLSITGTEAGVVNSNSANLGSPGLPRAPTSIAAGSDVPDIWSHAEMVTDVCTGSTTSPAISVSPALSYYFGNVGVGTTATRQFTITNTGDADLTIDSIVCEDSLDPPFSLLGGSTCTFPNIIPPTGTCTYTVQFAPSATGYVTDTFDICSDAPDDPLLTVSGTGMLYTLNVFRTGNGSGTVTSTDSLINCGSDCQETYTLNTQVTLSALPNTGSTFTGWSGACTGTGQCMVTMSASQSVTAQFTLNTYPVTTSAGPRGSISPLSVSVNHGSSTQFVVTPDPGYQIASVSGCGGSLNQNTYTTGPVTAACTVTASFEVRNYMVTPSAGAHGRISPSEPQSVLYNGTVSFTVTPEEGYHIESVSGCGGTLAASTAETKKKRKNKRKNKIALLSSTYTTGPVTEDCTVTAVFAVNTYTVTAAAGEGGSVSPLSQAVSHGSSAQVTIAPGEGYHIESVSGCGGSLSDSIYTTGAITADCTVTAEFAVNTYTVTPLAGEHGSISPSEAQGVNHKGTVSFTVTPEEGYHIETVSGCGGSLSGTVMENAKKKKKKARRRALLAVEDAQTYTTGPVTADCTVTAEFAVNTYTVTPSAGEHGSISPSEAQGVNHKGTVSFTVTPEEGYHIETVSGCGGSLSDSTYTTGPVTADCTVTATFVINTYAVTTTADPEAGGTLDPVSADVEHGATTEFVVAPATGYHIETASGCGGSLSDSTYTTGPVTADCTVNAVFGKDIHTLSILLFGEGSGSVLTDGLTCDSEGCTGQYEYGDRVVLKIIPDAGSRIVDIRVDGVSVGATSMLTLRNITGDHTIEIVFEPA